MVRLARKNVCFTMALTGEKRIKNKSKTSGHGWLLPVTPNMGFCSNCHILNLNDVALQVRRVKYISITN